LPAAQSPNIAAAVTDSQQKTTAEKLDHPQGTHMDTLITSSNKTVNIVSSHFNTAIQQHDNAIGKY